MELVRDSYVRGFVPRSFYDWGIGIHLTSECFRGTGNISQLTTVSHRLHHDTTCSAQLNENP